MKHLTQLIIALCCCCNPTHAMPDMACTNQRDSLEIALQLERGRHLRDADSMKIVFQAALDRSLKIGCSHLVFISCIELANRSFDEGNYSGAIVHIERAFPYCSTIDDKVTYYHKLGWGHLFCGNYVLASVNFHTALQILRFAQASESKTAFAYNNLAELYVRLGQFDKAMANYNICQALSARYHDSDLLSRVLINKSEFYISQHNFDSADCYLRKCIELTEQRHQPHADKSHAYELLGRNYVEAGQYDKAAGYLREAIDLAMGRRRFIVIDASFDLAKVLLHQKKYVQAEQILLPALAEARSGKMIDNTVQAYQTLVGIYKATGRYDKVISYMDSISIFKDTIASIRKMQVINEMDMKYNLVEKDRQLAQNQLQIAHQKNNIAHKNIWILTAAGSVVVLLLVSLVFYRNSMHHIRMLQQNNKISVLKAAAQSEDNERRRIARDLHDGIGGMLSAAVMRFSALEPQSITSNDSYRKAMAILNEMGAEIRKTAHNLMPGALLHQTLPEALQNFCSSTQASGDLQITFQSHGHFDNLNEQVKLNLYRVVQELLGNISRHAHATVAFVQLVATPERLTVTVEDNGNGFDTANVNPGMGLSNIRNRVCNLDGRIIIESEPGSGTSVFIDIALTNAHLSPSLTQNITHEN